MNDSFPFHDVSSGQTSLTAHFVTRAGHLDVWALQLKVGLEELPLSSELATSVQVGAPNSQLFHELHRYLVKSCLRST